MKKLLFIKLKHIGDTLILTPTLMAARAAHPDAVIWVVVRKGCEGILAGCPAIDRVLTAAAPEAKNRSGLTWLQDFRLIRQLRAERFDFAFELSDGDRGRTIAWLSGAKVRCTNVAVRPLHWFWKNKFNRKSHYDWMVGHKVEKDFFTVSECLPLGGIVPALSFERNFTEPWPVAAELKDFALIHPGTRWQRKRWPLENWIELGRKLLTRFPNLIISCGPDAEEVALAAAIQAALGQRALNTEGKLNWKQLAGLLHRARLFVGVDTAAMHLAAACQTPTVALFGPSSESHWKPWQTDYRLVQPDLSQCGSNDPLPRPEELLKQITVRQVLAACDDILLARSRVAG